MTGLVFVDTNVFVYRHDGSIPSSSNCKVLLTEDLQHGQAFDDVRVVDPFASPDRTPEEVLESLAS